MQEKDWVYRNNTLDAVPEGAVAFVYLLTHTSSGRAYIGKKGFWTPKYRQVKGKKKRYMVESDWRDYWSSSVEIQQMVKDGEAFTREILHLCGNKGTANYLEAREQMDRRVLENPEAYFNGIIQCKVHRTHIKL